MDADDTNFSAEYSTPGFIQPIDARSFFFFSWISLRLYIFFSGDVSSYAARNWMRRKDQLIYNIYRLRILYENLYICEYIVFHCYNVIHVNIVRI